ncbi:hypothetical protein BSM4216_3724 [Bacillus smithii]|nr:hypothetical protein BSM4216_3724 [Bacillus smithii]
MSCNQKWKNILYNPKKTKRLCKDPFIYKISYRGTSGCLHQKLFLCQHPRHLNETQGILFPHQTYFYCISKQTFANPPSSIPDNEKSPFPFGMR